MRMPQDAEVRSTRLKASPRRDCILMAIHLLVTSDMWAAETPSARPPLPARSSLIPPDSASSPPPGFARQVLADGGSEMHMALAEANDKAINQL